MAENDAQRPQERRSRDRAGRRTSDNWREATDAAHNPPPGVGQSPALPTSKPVCVHDWQQEPVRALAICRRCGETVTDIERHLRKGEAR